MAIRILCVLLGLLATVHGTTESDSQNTTSFKQMIVNNTKSIINIAVSQTSAYSLNCTGSKVYNALKSPQPNIEKLSEKYNLPH